MGLADEIDVRENARTCITYERYRCRCAQNGHNCVSSCLLRDDGRNRWRYFAFFWLCDYFLAFSFHSLDSSCTHAKPCTDIVYTDKCWEERRKKKTHTTRLVAAKTKTKTKDDVNDICTTYVQFTVSKLWCKHYGHRHALDFRTGRNGTIVSVIYFIS